MGTWTSWRTVIGSTQPPKQLRHLIRRLSLGVLMLSLVGCATVKREYPDIAALQADRSGEACSNGKELFLVSCWFTDYGRVVPKNPNATTGAAYGTYEETPLGWEIADALTAPLVAGVEAAFLLFA